MGYTAWFPAIKPTMHGLKFVWFSPILIHVWAPWLYQLTCVQPACRVFPAWLMLPAIATLIIVFCWQERLPALPTSRTQYHCKRDSPINTVLMRQRSNFLSFHPWWKLRKLHKLWPALTVGEKPHWKQWEPGSTRSYLWLFTCICSFSDYLQMIGPECRLSAFNRGFQWESWCISCW